MGSGAQLVTNPVNSNDARVSATIYVTSTWSGQWSGRAGGGHSVARDSSRKGCERPTPFVTTEDVTQLLHTYCLRLGYPFTNISKETRSYDFIKRDLQGDPQTIQADL